MTRKPSPAHDFGLTPDLQAWGQAHNFTRLDERMEWFKDYLDATGKRYLDYKAAFRNSVRSDWAKLNGTRYAGVESHAEQKCALCHGSLARGHVKRRVGLVCLECENK